MKMSLRLVLAAFVPATLAFAQTAVPVTTAIAGGTSATNPTLPTAPATVVTVVPPGSGIPVPVVPTPISPTLALTGNAEQPAASGETSITLDINFGIRAVAPSRVTVPAGETLRITGPSFAPRSMQWLKNNQAIPGATTNPLILTSVRSSDAGTYVLVNNEPNVSSLPSQALILGVGQPERLLNISTRAYVGAGEQTLISGFVVGGAREKKIIVRAIGLSLASFGVRNFLAAPRLAFFDAAGQPYTNGYAYPAVVGGLTYQQDLADSLAKIGAFPVTAGLGDIVEMRPFAPGSYTVQITSASGASGIVLLEIYEVP